MQEAEFHGHVGEQDICRSVADAARPGQQLIPGGCKVLPRRDQSGSAKQRRLGRQPPRWQHHRVMSLSIVESGGLSPQQ